ncbi:hypothetical protein TWF679_009635 [Orbilia oligospora]|uniref:Uncharacterized protein n=2 Tax=Orbilia oligospora TaxID=2813651 RepID=A0A8H8VJ97_ORBOL|nr:hypothetical protein TWF679_009635 [Orbilia oligospora]
MTSQSQPTTVVGTVPFSSGFRAPGKQTGIDNWRYPAYTPAFVRPVVLKEKGHNEHPEPPTPQPDRYLTTEQSRSRLDAEDRNTQEEQRFDREKIPGFPCNIFYNPRILRKQLSELKLPKDSKEYSFLLGFSHDGTEYDYKSTVGNLPWNKELRTVAHMNDRDLRKIVNHLDDAEVYRFYISRDIRSFSEKGLRYIFGGHGFSPDFLHNLAFNEKIGFNSITMITNDSLGRDRKHYGLYFTMPLREIVSSRWAEEAQLGRFSQIDHRSSLQLFGTDGEINTLADTYGLAFYLEYDFKTLKTTVFIKMRIGVTRMIQSLRSSFRMYRDTRMKTETHMHTSDTDPDIRQREGSLNKINGDLGGISDGELDKAENEMGEEYLKGISEEEEKGEGEEKKKEPNEAETERGLAEKRTGEDQMDEQYGSNVYNDPPELYDGLYKKNKREDTGIGGVGQERNDNKNESGISGLPQSSLPPPSLAIGPEDPYFIVIVILKAWIDNFKKGAHKTVHNNTTWLDEKTQTFIRFGGDRAMYDDLNFKIHITQRTIAQIETEIGEAVSIFEQLESQHNLFLKIPESRPSMEGSGLVRHQIRQIEQEGIALQRLFRQEAIKIETCSRWLSEAMSQRNTEAIKAATTAMSEVLEETKKLTKENRKEAKLMSQIAINTQKDGQSMKIIAILTMIFLPGSFVSSVFGWNIISFDVSEDGGQSLVISKQGLQIFLISFFTFTLVTISGCWIWVSNSQKSLTLANADIQRIGEDEKAVGEDSP